LESAAGKRGLSREPSGSTISNRLVEAFVEQHRRVERHDHVDAEEQLAQPFVDMEVDRAFGLIIRARPVKHGDIAAPRDGERHLERAVAEPVVVDIVGEADGFFGYILPDHFAHGLARAVEKHVAGGHVGVAAETVAEFTARGWRPCGTRR